MSLCSLRLPKALALEPSITVPTIAIILLGTLSSVGKDNGTCLDTARGQSCMLANAQKKKLNERSVGLEPMNADYYLTPQHFPS